MVGQRWQAFIWRYGLSASKGRAFWKDIHAVTGFWVLRYFYSFQDYRGQLHGAGEYSAMVCSNCSSARLDDQEESHHQKQKFDQAVKHMSIIIWWYPKPLDWMLNRHGRLNFKSWYFQTTATYTTSGAMAGTWSISSQTQNREKRLFLMNMETWLNMRHLTAAWSFDWIWRCDSWRSSLLNLMIGVFTVIALILVVDYWCG